MHGKATYTKVSLLRYYIYFTEISGHVLNAFNDIFSALFCFSLSPACRLLRKTHVQRANYKEFMCQAMNGIVGKLIMMAHRFWTGSKIYNKNRLKYCMLEGGG